MLKKTALFLMDGFPYHGDFEDDDNFEYDTDFKTMVIIKTMTITEHEQAGDEKTAGGWSEHTWSCFIAR